MPSSSTLERIQRVQVFTIVWTSIESAVSLVAAWLAHSPALLAFGADSVIELISAALVFGRFRRREVRESTERRVNRIAGGLLVTLAVYVIVVSVFAVLGHREPQPSYTGIVLLAVATVAMPVFAREKRKLSVETHSPVLRADAAQSKFCGYLSLIALVGVGVNATWQIHWADPAAALAIAPFILREGWEAVQGKPSGGGHGEYEEK